MPINLKKGRLVYWKDPAMDELSGYYRLLEDTVIENPRDPLQRMTITKGNSVQIAALAGELTFKCEPEGMLQRVVIDCLEQDSHFESVCVAKVIAGMVGELTTFDKVAELQRLLHKFIKEGFIDYRSVRITKREVWDAAA